MIWNSGAGTWFGTWVCDMGLYTGPWPPQPPGLIDGTGSGDEIDFYIGLPNPADPTDLTLVFDGSYDTQVWDVYRYDNAPGPPTTLTYFSFFAEGSASDPDYTSPAITGAHLYVAAYMSGGPPSNPPEFYVPPSYAVGGAATLETLPGAWSDWQGGFTTDPVTSSEPHGRALQTPDTEISADADLDVTTTANVNLAAQLATATWIESGLNCATDVIAQKFAPGFSGFGSPAHTDVSAGATQQVAQFHANPGNPIPPPLLSLVEGVDYWFYPGGNEWEFLGGLVAAYNWLTIDGDYSAADDASTSASGATCPMYLQTYSVLPNVGDSNPVSGTTLATYTLDPSDGGIVHTFSVALPSGLGQDIYIGAIPDPFVSNFTSASAPNFSMPGSGAHRYRWTGNLEFTANPQFTVDTNEWRYWIPGAVVSTSPATAKRGWGILV